MSTEPGSAGLSQEPEERPAPSEVPASADPSPADQGEGGPSRAGNMLPGRDRRRFGLERIFVRLVATCGVVGIGVLLGAILVSSKVQGWITGLAVALVSVVLSAVLWSSRQL